MNEVTLSLRSIAKGTLFSSAGMFVALLLSFLQRWIIIRATTPEEYGLYSLSLAIIAVAVSLGGLGLEEGIPRTVSFFSSSSDVSKRSIFFSLILLSIGSGGVCCLLLFFGSPQISSFLGKDITWIMKMLSLSIPFALLLGFLISFFRGFERAEVRALFNDLFKNIAFLSVLVIIFLKGLSLPAVVAGYLLSVAAPALLIVMYTFRKMGAPQLRGSLPLTEEMLLFSLPLLAGSLFQVITVWADTLLLGVFRSSEEVALYNAALPTSKLIQTFLGAVLFIYIPVATSLFSRKLLSELKRVYAVISKWVIFVTLPLFTVLFLYAHPLFLFLYGDHYTKAVLSFRIISMGYLISASVGPNAGTLIAMGKSRAVMVIIVLSAMTNLVSNSILIPRIGMEGAAISMVMTLMVASATGGTMLYRASGIHPFTRNFVRPLLLYVIFVWGFQTVLKNLVSVEAWMIPFLLGVYLFLYALSMIVTKSIDEEDIWMLSLVEKRTGVNLKSFKKILRKILR